MPIDLGGMNKKILPKLNGRIAIGRKTAQGFPEKLDHFIFTEQVDPKTKTAPVHKVMTAAMKEIYGEFPKAIKVVLPFHHIDEVFYTNFANYTGSSWDCKSDDGVVARRKLPNGELKAVPCNHETCEWRWNCKDRKGNPMNTCKPHGLLSVFVLNAPISGGVWRFTSSSYLSISEILQTLEMVQKMRKGSLMGVEVLLKVRMDQKEIKINGATSKQNVPIVYIEVPVPMLTLADGASTVYGDFKSIIAAVSSTEAIPNSQIIRELSTSLDGEEALESSVADAEVVDSSDQGSVNNTSNTCGAPADDVDLF